MNAEDDSENREMPEELKRFMDSFNDSLRNAKRHGRKDIGAKKDNNELPPTKPKGSTPMRPISMDEAMRRIAKHIKDDELMDANAFTAISGGLVSHLHRMGVSLVLFTRYVGNPTAVTDDQLSKIIHPVWKVHKFERQESRLQGEFCNLTEGDKLVVVTPDPHAARVLSYYVECTLGLPCDDDYRVDCKFAGGCSLMSDLFMFEHSKELNSVLDSTLFDSNIAAPPVSDDLRDLLDDPEFQLIQDLV